MPKMGSLAALDTYGLPDVGEPMIPGGISTEGVPWANRLVDYFTSGLPQQTDETVRYRTASPLVNITEGDIGRATEAAMGASAGGLSTKGIKAYHSSPHDFDKFDLARIGTGEGAQVYGHGLYFAENPAVSGRGGQYWDQFLRRFSGDEKEVASSLRSANFDRDKAAENMQRAIASLQRRVEPGGIFDKPHMADAAERARQQVEIERRQLALLQSGKLVGPRTYEVDIKADPAHMLDWDKTLSQQSGGVRDIMGEHIGPRVDTWGNMHARFYKPMDEILKGTQAGQFTKGENYFTPGAVNIDAVRASVGPEKAAQIDALLLKHQKDMEMSGADAYRSVTERAAGPELATQALREAGIPGIKYLDQGSRNAGTGSSNYVIFDPSIIDITKKYAVPGALGAGGMGALAAQDRYEP